MRIGLITVFVLSFAFQACGQKENEFTTFILVRHAEKATDGTDNPGLTEGGNQRAVALARMLNETKVDAVYSTKFKRTMNTAGPLCEEKKLTIQNYNAFKGEEIEKMLTDLKGQTIVMIGHSNSIPWTANYLLGKEVYPNFEDSDYDNVMVLTVLERGRANVTWLNYGSK